MKKIFTLKTLLVALLCVMGVSSSWADVVTFTFKTDTDITYTETGTSGTGSECIVSKGNVTLQGTSAYTDKGKTLSCYANSTLKITAPGKITQIDLTYNGKVYPFDEALGDDTKDDKGKFAASGEHVVPYTPETPENSITLTNSNGGKTELLTLTVTYATGTIVNVTGVSLDITSKTIMVDEFFKLTQTVSPDNATNKAVSWSSSDEDVATVVGGRVLGVGAGTATITATTTDGNKTATCTVTVNPKTAPAGAVFFETFDQFDGDGGVDGTWSGITTTKALGTFDNEGWTTEGSVLSGYKCASIRKVDSSTPSGLTTPAIGITGDGTVRFNAESWGTDGTNFFVDIVGDGTFVVDENLAEGNISNDGTTAKVAMTKTGNFTTYNLQFTGLTADSKFRFYAPANKRAFLDEVAVISASAPTSYSLTIGESCYATYFDSEHAYTMPDDCEGYVFTDGKLEAIYEDGDVVPAGEPLVIWTLEPGEKTLVYTTSTEETYKSGGLNDLEGTDTETALEADADSYFYALSLNAAGDAESVGFYWMEDEGAAFTNGAHKAYLKLAKETGAKSAILFNEATAIKDVKSETATVRKQLLNGQLVIKTANGTFTVAGAQVK